MCFVLLFSGTFRSARLEACLGFVLKYVAQQDSKSFIMVKRNFILKSNTLEESYTTPLRADFSKWYLDNSLEYQIQRLTTF